MAHIYPPNMAVLCKLLRHIWHRIWKLICWHWIGDDAHLWMWSNIFWRALLSIFSYILLGVFRSTSNALGTSLLGMSRCTPLQSQTRSHVGHCILSNIC